MTNFGVILPTIWRDTLPDAIDSVLSQTHKDFVLVIACDNKGAWEEVNKLPQVADKRIMVVWKGNVKSSNDSGATARNYGISMLPADIEYICHIDDDDLWYPERLFLFNDYILKHPWLDLFHSYGKLLKWKLVHPRSSERALRPIAELHEPICGSMCYKKSLFQKTNGWSSVNVTSHDSRLWQDMLAFSKEYGILDKVTFKFILEK